MSTQTQHEIEVRKLQTLSKERYLLNIPKNFVTKLGMKQHDLVKFSLDGNRMIVEKACFEGDIE